MTLHAQPSARRYRLNVQDYELLAASGALRDLRTELIEGEIVLMSPQYRPHGMVKLELYDRLRDALREMRSPLWPVVEFSLALSADSMPDPDLMLTSEPRGSRAVPLPSVALIIEVADSSLADDLGTKMRLYASHGVPEYWVADVNGRTIHQMWVPAGDGYAERRSVPFGQPISAVMVEGLTIDTDGM